MKKLFEEPYVDVIKFSALDVFTIASSPEQGVTADDEGANAVDW